MGEIDRSQIQKPESMPPHLVLLGAGASLAALPDGDRHSRALPLMRNIVDVLGLGAILDGSGVTEDRDDFERLYSHLVASGTNDALVAKIEQAIFAYFSALELPDRPTLYDHLVRSLRGKDLIATFNWDPFLVQAVRRAQLSGMTDVPNLVFLHGNVAIGHCTGHRPIGLGLRGRTCPVCRSPLEDSRLLYPVESKDYNRDPLVAKMWELVQHYLKHAFAVTFFGYSAPVSDVEAVDLLRTGWGNPEDRKFEQIEVIDIRRHDELREVWDPFIHSHHYEIADDFYESLIGHSPRRSIEATWMRIMEAEFIEPNPVPRDAGWEELDRFYGILLEDEETQRHAGESEGK